MASYNDIEDKFYNKMNDTLSSQSLEILIELVQPWEKYHFDMKEDSASGFFKDSSDSGSEEFRFET